MIGPRMMMKKSAALPYDAEVEYLESTGTQWIDTDIPLTFPVSVDLSLAMVSPYGTSGSLPIFGNRANYGGAKVAIWFTTGNKMYALNYGSYDSGYVLPYVTDGQKVSLAIQNGAKLYLDGTLIADGGSPTTQDDTGTILLFQMRDTNKAPASRGQCLRLFSCRFYKSGECVRDLIPVRFTNELGESEGAMYDRVSGDFFRNAGSGEFRFGTDIAGGGING